MHSLLSATDIKLGVGVVVLDQLLGQLLVLL
jgi:hypothetical protein